MLNALLHRMDKMHFVPLTRNQREHWDETKAIKATLDDHIKTEQIDRAYIMGSLATAKRLLNLWGAFLAALLVFANSDLGGRILNFVVGK